MITRASKLYPDIFAISKKKIVSQMFIREISHLLKIRLLFNSFYFL